MYSAHWLADITKHIGVSQRDSAYGYEDCNRNTLAVKIRIDLDKGSRVLRQSADYGRGQQAINHQVAALQHSDRLCYPIGHQFTGGSLAKRPA